MVREYMSSKRRFLGAVMGGRVDRPSVASATSVVTIDIMEKVKVYFPEAHLDSEKMAVLAATSYTILGYDAIAPVFSVQQEAEALGCIVDWGKRDSMPVIRRHPYKGVEDIKIPSDFLERPSCMVVIEAIKRLKKQYVTRWLLLEK